VQQEKVDTVIDNRNNNSLIQGGRDERGGRIKEIEHAKREGGEETDQAQQ